MSVTQPQNLQQKYVEDNSWEDYQRDMVQNPDKWTGIWQHENGVKIDAQNKEHAWSAFRMGAKRVRELKDSEKASATRGLTGRQETELKSVEEARDREVKAFIAKNGYDKVEVGKIHDKFDSITKEIKDA